MSLADREELLRQAYRRFNDRDVEGVLALLDPQVEWPDMIQHRILRGTDAVREYWEGQFRISSPTVVARELVPAGEDIVAVVDQQVHDLAGAPLAPANVVAHRYSFRDGAVVRMVVFDSLEDALQAPSAGP